MKKSKLMLTALALSGIFTAAALTKADTTEYRLYNPNSGEHFWTGNVTEKNSLVKAGWHDEGIGWVAPSTSKSPAYRLYNPNSGEHFYTLNAAEKNSLTKAGWKYEGIAFYSGGKIPLYRVYNPHSGLHFYTADANERNSLVKAGWKYEGIAWYADRLAPIVYYNWNYDVAHDTYSGQKNDVHYPQFEYLSASGKQATTYPGTNNYVAYNDTVFSFNLDLSNEAANDDYADWQARQNWTNEQKTLALAANDAQAKATAANNKVNEAAQLASQAQTYLNDDQQNGADSAVIAADTAALTQAQSALSAAKSVAGTAAAADQTAQTKLNTYNKVGTDWVTLTYTVTRSADNKTADVHFTRSSRVNGKVTKKVWTVSKTMVS